MHGECRSSFASYIRCDDTAYVCGRQPKLFWLGLAVACERGVANGPHRARVLCFLLWLVCRSAVSAQKEIAARLAHVLRSLQAT